MGAMKLRLPDWVRLKGLFEWIKLDTSNEVHPLLLEAEFENLKAVIVDAVKRGMAEAKI